MSTGYNIRWRNKDVKELQRVTRNFNAKIDRVVNKNPSAKNFLPSKISAKDLKITIDTRADFNRQLNSIKRFSKQGAETIKTSESGLSLSTWTIKETKNKQRIANFKKTMELKKLNIDITKGNMGQIEHQGLKPKKFTTNKSQKEWDVYVKTLENQIKSNFNVDKISKYKEDYLKAIRDYLGEDGQELYDTISNLSPEEIYTESIDNPIQAIGFTSDPLPTKTIAQHALNAWKKSSPNHQEVFTEDIDELPIM